MLISSKEKSDVPVADIPVSDMRGDAVFANAATAVEVKNVRRFMFRLLQLSQCFEHSATPEYLGYE